jgi:HAD superfamily hydrolase (TIGR01509 family)
VTKLLIFDHDMTIVDSNHAIMSAINQVASALGKPGVTRDVVMRFAAVPLADFLLGIWGEAKKEWIDLYREKAAPLEFEIRPFPEVPGALTKLRDMGIALAVASNRYDPRAAMDKSGTSRYFDAIVGPIDGLPPKPDPAMVNRLMRLFAASRPETLYVGDSDIDMETARAAGVRFVGVATGNFTRPQLESLGAWRAIDSMAGLPPLVQAPGAP